MADAVVVSIQDSDTHLLVHLVNVSDSTGESAVQKVDKSAYTVNGAEPASLDIETVRWSIQGFTSVRLLWDHDTDDVALALANSGYDDFRGDGFARFKKGLPDPRSSGGTGDLLLTTAGAVSGATYDITLRLRKTPQ